jgi:hypothetical protein
VEVKSLLPLPEIEPTFFGNPDRGPPLYRLSCLVREKNLYATATPLHQGNSRLTWTFFFLKKWVTEKQSPFRIVGGNTALTAWQVAMRLFSAH